MKPDGESSHAIAIFVKTPGLSPIKTRLAQTLGEARALEFYRLSVEALKETVLGAVSLASSPTCAYWAVAENSPEAARAWKDLAVVHQKEGSLGDRLHHVYQNLRREHDVVTLIGADAPQLTPDLLEAPCLEILARGRQEPRVVVGPARDGGFYLFSSNAEISEKVWTTTTFSHSRALQELLANLGEGYSVSRLPLLTDVDEMVDLESLARELHECANPMRSQLELLAWLREFNFGKRI